MKENICTKLRFPSNWKKLEVTSLMVFLCISLFASEPIDFDKAFKESVKINNKLNEPASRGKFTTLKTLEPRQIPPISHVMNRSIWQLQPAIRKEEVPSLSLKELFIQALLQ